MAATKTAHSGTDSSKVSPKASVHTSAKSKTLAGQVIAPADSARTTALEHYQTALRLMQEGQYEQAHKAFDALLATSPADISERIRMYISACLQQVTKGANKFATPEEQFDYAISLLNEGHYDDARHHLAEILKADQHADYAFYGLAILSSMTGDSQTCLEHLSEAIRLKPQNRILARGDSDFEDMADDPRFTELLYPEI